MNPPPAKLTSEVNNKEAHFFLSILDPAAQLANTSISYAITIIKENEELKSKRSYRLSDDIVQPEPVFEEQTEDRDKVIAILKNNLKRSLEFKKKVNDHKSLSFSLSP